MVTSVDLKQLAVERTAPTASAKTRPRAWVSRFVVPAFIIGGFLGIAGWAAREHWLPAQPVTVVPVIMTKAEVQQSGTPLFQAAGWIEPRPTAVMCTALVEGVVDELLVIEGQEVTVGQPVAKMIDSDAKLLLREAEATLNLRQAERDAMQAALTAADQNLKQPVQLEAAHAEAEATLANIETELKNLPYLVDVAESRLKLAKLDYESKKSIGDAIAGRTLQKSLSEMESATAALEELKQRRPNLEKQQQASQRRCDALHTRLKLKTDEQRAVDEAKANLAAAEAKVQQAVLAVETVQLRLDRMTVKSPINGRVLALNAQPGRRLMGINAASERDASTVVTLYDPQQLQIRADVRLEDVRQITLGQPVQISTAATNEPMTGKVLAVTSLADIQKNTLQVKVGIDRPSLMVRPEMLAQVVFLAPETPNAKIAAAEQPLRLMIPKELVIKDEGSTSVWLADSAQGIARKQPVTLGKASTEQLVEVTGGLTALDKLIVRGRETLTDGTRIRVSGADEQLGISNKNTSQAALPSSTTK
jgi:RND family efflux transporter MFP subunit